MKIEIKNRWFGIVLFVAEVPEGAESGMAMRLALEQAVAAGANLRDANLRDADLSGASLSDADLSGASLSDADLSDANLRGADLSDANLSGASLSDADLRDANLRGADLSDANLRGADLRPIKADFIELISHAPLEVPALIAALKEGRVDGTTYSGPCSCLVGTIATARGVEISALPGIAPDAYRPAEGFFASILEGDTPETNSRSKMALEWAEEFQATMDLYFERKRFPAPAITK
jgi:hypothetical protein